MHDLNAQADMPTSMSTQNVEQAPASGPAGDFPMSRDGRRQAIILFIGVLSLIVFAVWSLATILDGGLDGAEWVSALLMLGIILVAPIVAWTMLEEANGRIEVTSNGLRYSSLGGVKIDYPWAEISGYKPRNRRGRIARLFLGEEEIDQTEEGNAAQAADPANYNNENIEEESEDEQTLALEVRDAYKPQVAAQLPNPIVRFLHMQAYGTALPIYGGLEKRGELMAVITSHLEANEK